MLPERFETVEEAIQAYLDSIIGPYRKMVEADRKLKRIQKLIDSGKATYSDGHDYAIRCGQLLKSVFGNVFDAADFPDGIFDYDLAKGIFPPAFRQNYEVISSGCSTIQQSLNERAGLGIKVQIPEYNQDRAFGIAKKVSSDLFENTAWVLAEPVINASQSIVDDFIEENAAFHLDAGLKPKIVRSVVGGCCEWCQNLAGTYDYSPDMDRSVFRRHNRCRCTTEYNPGDGRRQDVWTKKWNNGISNDDQREKENSDDDELKKKIAELLHPKKDPSMVSSPGKQIETGSFAFDAAHINEERGHGVSEEEAVLYIRKALFSLSVWNGRFERYYSDDGVAYVDLMNNNIRTAFSKSEFKNAVVKALEVFHEYKG